MNKLLIFHVGICSRVVKLNRFFIPIDYHSLHLIQIFTYGEKKKFLLIETNKNILISFFLNLRHKGKLKEGASSASFAACVQYITTYRVYLKSYIKCVFVCKVLLHIS